MVLKVTDDFVRSVLPNILITVDEEIPIASRIEPYFKDAVQWVEKKVLGSFDLPEQLQSKAARVVVLHACSRAIPALDIVVTPSGLGVVSSDRLVPASKERIERLIKHLSEDAIFAIMDLQSCCINYPEWRDTKIGKWYCSTFYPYLFDAHQLTKEGQDVFDVYKQARAIAEQFENALEREYLGHELMQILRDDFYGEQIHHRIISNLHDGIFRHVLLNIHSRSSRCPDEHVPWHFAESILNMVKQDKKLRKIWKDSMGKKFDVEPFKNTRKGGYFF